MPSPPPRQAVVRDTVPSPPVPCQTGAIGSPGTRTSGLGPGTRDFVWLDGLAPAGDEAHLGPEGLARLLVRGDRLLQGACHQGQRRRRPRRAPGAPFGAATE